jgi:hypothetical protein
MDALGVAIAGYQVLRERVRHLEPEVDETTLHDTLDGLSDLQDMIEAIVRGALSDEAMAAGLRLRLKELQERLARIEGRADTRRQIARDAMLDADIPTLRRAEFTLTLRPGSPSVSVVDEKLIPASFWEPREPRLNKAGLLAELKRGVSVPGATLATAEPVLMVRVR